jgi:antitoxin (DNA-binding transcriptional repressor) of toxin-antitoxin stability system
MTIHVDAEEFGEEFVAACDAAASGEEVYLVLDGVRVAQLVPYSPIEQDETRTPKV